MTGALIRRLGKLETAAGIRLVLPTIFVTFIAADGTDPLWDKAIVNGKVWHRDPDEAYDAFRSRA
jgi:hypothetical protein